MTFFQRSKKKAARYLTVALAACLLLVPMQHAEAGKGQVVLVLVPGLSMDDFFQLLQHDGLRQGMAAAALNRVTAASSTPANEMLTLVSGVPAETSQKLLNSWKEESDGGGQNTYSLDSYPDLLVENQATTYGAAPGILGEKMIKAGTVPVFAGHSNVGGSSRSYAPFFVVDFEGTAAGNRDRIVDKNKAAPGGWNMNVDNTLQWLDKALLRGQTPIIEWGDVYRFHEADGAGAASKQLASLRELLVELKNREESVFLLGVDPFEGSMLPFARWTYQDSASMRGMQSSTTGQLYLGSSEDIAPTLLRSQLIPPPASWHGSSLESAGKTSIQEFETEIQGVRMIHDSRGSVLSIYITVLIALLAAGFLYGKFSCMPSSKWINFAVITGMASPFAFTLLPAFFGRPEMPVFVYAGLLTAAAFGTGAAALGFGREKAVFIVSLLLLGLLTFDLLNGAYAIQRSYLGYDPIIGARYRGIGNELGGFFAAAAVVCLEPVLRYKKTAALPLILCFLIITGSSLMGENAGVTIASGLMFGTLWTGDLIKTGWKWMITAAAAAGLFLLGLLWLLQFTGESSHIGAAFSQLMHGEWRELQGLLLRKSEMNIKIIFHSNWTKLLITSYALASFYLLMEKKTMMRPSQQLVLKAGTAGSLFLLLFNDSGAVAASTSMFYLLCVRYLWTRKRS